MPDMYNKNTLSIANQFLKSNYTSFSKFYEDILAKSDIPKVPEITRKKKKKRVKLYNKRLEEKVEPKDDSNNTEIIDKFLSELDIEEFELKDKEKFIKKFISKVKEFSGEENIGEAQKKIFNMFQRLLIKYYKETSTPKDREKLSVILISLFGSVDDKREPLEERLYKNYLLENIVSDVLGLADEAFNPFKGFFSAITAPIIDFVVDIKDDIKSDNEEKSNDKKKVLKKDASNKKDTETKDIKNKDKSKEELKKDETPEQFKKRTGSCPDGYIWNDRKKVCVNKK